MPDNILFQEQLSQVGKARIFFGHQSVGQNLLDGLKGLMDASASQVNIVKLDKAQTLPPGPCLAHAFIGENSNPASKIRAFSGFLDLDSAKQYDVALMKFCYLDITRDTDVRMLFQLYRDTIAAIRKRHPGLILIHATSPLTYENGFRTFVKKILRKRTAADDNAKRAEYNGLLIREFENDPILDISRIESTRPDGGRLSGLFCGYTSDGGHLNETGSKLLAREFVRVASEALQRRQP